LLIIIYNLNTRIYSRYNKSIRKVVIARISIGSIISSVNSNTKRGSYYIRGYTRVFKRVIALYSSRRSTSSCSRKVGIGRRIALRLGDINETSRAV